MVLDAAFVIAAVAFFKAQMELTGRKVLLAAFGVVLFVAIEPPIVALFPLAAPVISAVVGAVKLFITAAGSVDFVKSLISYNAKVN
jgi:hypothetical protein